MRDAALLGAGALRAVVFDAIFWSFGSPRMATAGLTAQAISVRDAKDADGTLATALAAGTITGLVLVLAQVPIAAGAYQITGASAEVFTGFSTFSYIRIVAAPLTLANYAILGSLARRGRTDVGLMVQVALNLSNIALILPLVLGPELGIVGAGLSALIAESAGAACGLVVLHRLGARPFQVPVAAILDAAAFSKTLGVKAASGPSRSSARSRCSPRSVRARATSRRPLE